MRTVHFWAVRFYETSFYFRGDFMIREELDRLLCDAKSNAELKEKLLKTEQSENPIDNFCFLCRSHGYKSVQANFLHSDLTKATPSFAV